MATYGNLCNLLPVIDRNWGVINGDRQLVAKVTKVTKITLKKAKIVPNSKQLGTNKTGYGLWDVTFFFPILRFDEADMFASNLGREPMRNESRAGHPFLIQPCNLNKSRYAE